jgi:y4mF family transcriptional regulator
LDQHDHAGFGDPANRSHLSRVIGIIMLIMASRAVPGAALESDQHDRSDLGVAHTIRERRRRLRLTQEDLAALSGVATRTVGAIEQGKTTVRLDVLTAVLGALGLQLRAEPAQGRSGSGG